MNRLRLKGIHLKHRKNTASFRTEVLEEPELVIIPMNMNIGQHSVPIVKAGDHVDIGQKIADSDAFLSVPIHSSVSGTVKGITHIRDVHERCRALKIEPDGKHIVFSGIRKPEIRSKAELIKAVRESGLTGLGGASFPTHIKLDTKAKIDTLIINAAECEPYITSDHREMLEGCDDIVTGIKLILKYLKIRSCVIGIEKNKPDAIALLRKKTSKEKKISVLALPSIYPQGAEKVIVYNMTGRVIEEGQLPADKGVIVMNVSTVSFIGAYSRTGMPLIERRVTVDGDAVGKPCNLMVKIGTPVSKLLDYAQCDRERVNKLILGGPMMGTAAVGEDAVIGKSNNCILALERLEEKHTTSCIRCGRCISVCPLGLMPVEIETAYNRKDIQLLKRLRAELCMDCGCCSYICPAGRNLAEINRLAAAIVKGK